MQVMGPSGVRLEAVDDLLHLAEAAGLLTCRSSTGGELRPYAGVLEALDEAVVRQPSSSTTCRPSAASSSPPSWPVRPPQHRSASSVAARELLVRSGPRAGW